MTSSPKSRSTLTLAFIAVLFASCATEQHDRDQLNAFASAYVNFHKVLRDSEISMYATGLDVSGDESLSPYRLHFVRAFDVHATNRVRADNAKQAVTAQGSDNLLDGFEESIEVCDAKSLALVEAANRIENDANRQHAVSLSATARSMLGPLAKLHDDYAEIYSLQLRLANEMDQSNGDIQRVGPLMVQTIPKQNRLFDETDELRKQEQDSVRSMEGEYAALKGASGITLDYQAPTDDDTSSQH